jgi:hypothetical protein
MFDVQIEMLHTSYFDQNDQDVSVISRSGSSNTVRYGNFAIAYSSVAYMKFLIPFVCFILITNFATAQKPQSGTYTYVIVWDEFGGKDLGNTCTVIINKDSIKVVHNGKPNLTGNKGDVLVQGILLKHKSGKWIIGHSKKDSNASEIGGCSDGPVVIDFKRKIVYLC